MATEASTAAPGPAPLADYFDTDSRGQCVNLIIHLLHNTREMPCLCGPRGLGKTTFARHLEALLREDFNVLWVPLKTGEDLAPAVCRQLGLPQSPPASDWVRALNDLPGDKPLLVLVDDAERLSPNAQQAMLDMTDAGIRFVLVGAGLPSPALKSHTREIDLPTFSQEETREFLSYLGRRVGVPVASLDAAKLYKTSQGLPGVIVEQMEGRSIPKSDSPKGGGGLRPIILTLLLVGVISLALWFQDEINSLFRAPLDDDGYTTELPLPPQIKIERPVVSTPSPAAGRATVAEAEQAPPEAEQIVAEETAPEVALPAVQLDAAQPEEPSVPIETAPLVAQVPEQDETSVVTDEQPVVTEAPATQAEPAPEPPATQAKPLTENPPTQPTPEAQQRPTETPDVGEPWLRTQPADHFTLQLVGARERSAIDLFVRRNGLPKPYGVFVRDLGGKPWYSLVWGSFPDRDSALRASKQLPKGVRKDVWARDFGAIQAQLSR